MHKKSALTIAFVLVLFMSGLFVLRFVRSTSANFYAPSDILSPTNTTYTVNNVPLNVSVKIPAGFSSLYNVIVNEILFSLDGKANTSVSVTIESGSDEFDTYRANTLLLALSNGSRTIIAYARGTPNNEPYVVDSVNFYVDTASAPFPTTLVVAASASAFFIIAGLLFYFVKTKKIRFRILGS